MMRPTPPRRLAHHLAWMTGRAVTLLPIPTIVATLGLSLVALVILHGVLDAPRATLGTIALVLLYAITGVVVAVLLANLAVILMGVFGYPAAPENTPLKHLFTFEHPEKPGHAWRRARTSFGDDLGPLSQKLGLALACGPLPQWPQEMGATIHLVLNKRTITVNTVTSGAHTNPSVLRRVVLDRHDALAVRRVLFDHTAPTIGPWLAIASAIETELVFVVTAPPSAHALLAHRAHPKPHP